ncbi:MAG: ComEC/Rec2 family competence protein [Sandaracinaceae bacterium]|nr:ComEC/Rec2 family competence protein [Sandaracinaceae bacterium]
MGAAPMRSSLLAPSLSHYPLWLGSGALLGVLFAPPSWAPWAPLGVLGIASLFLLGASSIASRPQAFFGPLLFVLAFCASVPQPQSQVALDEFELWARVEASDRRRGVLLHIEKAEPQALPSQKAWASIQAPVGARIHLRATVKAPLPFRNESLAFRLEAPLGIPWLRIHRIESISSESDWIALWQRLRESLRTSIRQSLAADVEGTVLALVLGDPAIDPTDSHQIQRAGLSHVIAVSGMHVILIVGAVVGFLSHLLRRIEWIARRIDPRRPAWAVGALLAPLYAAFAGGSPSAWRAAWSASLGWILACCGRRPSPFAITGLVAIGTVSLNPRMAQSPGFLLSIVSTLVVLEPTIADSAFNHPSPSPWYAPIYSLLRSTFRATIATLPISIAFFASSPCFAVVANAIAVPVVANLLLPIGTIHALIAWLIPQLSPLSATLTELLVRAFYSIASTFGSHGFTLPPLSSIELLAISIGCAGLILLHGFKQRLIVLAICLLVGACGEIVVRLEQPKGMLRIQHLDVGQGDAALIDMPDGSIWLIDAGPPKEPWRQDAGEAIAELLSARRKKAIDVAVFTHPHPDHIGGFSTLTRRVVIRSIWDNGQASAEHPDGIWARRLGGMLVPLETPEALCAKPIRQGALTVDLIHPCPRFDPGLGWNDNSLVIRMSFGLHTFVFLGDVESLAESRLAPSIGKVDVVKVAHHGSRTSSTNPLLRALQPKLAVVSVGYGNPYGHPHQEVIERWESHGALLLRTDQEGSITLLSDGSTLKVHTWSGKALTIKAESTQPIHPK